jgi:hypothetical protein
MIVRQYLRPSLDEGIVTLVMKQKGIIYSSLH